MSNTNDNGCLPVLAFILYAVVIIGSGVLSWNLTTPESFVGAIGFMILWGFSPTSDILFSLELSHYYLKNKSL